jgi:hypothetical protein
MALELHEAEDRDMYNQIPDGNPILLLLFHLSLYAQFHHLRENSNLLFALPGTCMLEQLHLTLLTSS